MFEKKFILKCLPIFGKKILLKVVPEIVTIMYPTFILWKKYIMKCVPIFEKKILLKIVTWYCYHYVSYFSFLGRNLFWNVYKYLGRKFFCKFNFILLPLHILLLYLGRNLFWKYCLYVDIACICTLYLRRKFFWNLFFLVNVIYFSESVIYFFQFSAWIIICCCIKWHKHKK